MPVNDEILPPQNTVNDEIKIAGTRSEANVLHL
jgi:hypothetical protein